MKKLPLIGSITYQIKDGIYHFKQERKIENYFSSLYLGDDFFTHIKKATKIKRFYDIPCALWDASWTVTNFRKKEVQLGCLIATNLEDEVLKSTPINSIAKKIADHFYLHQKIFENNKELYLQHLEKLQS